MREIAKLIIMNKSDRDYVEKLSVIPKSKLGPMYFARYLLLTLYEILERKCNDKSVFFGKNKTFLTLCQLPEVPYTMITEGKRQRTRYVIQISKRSIHTPYCRYYVGLKKEWLQIWDKCGLLSHVKEIVNKEPHLLQESKDEAPHGWEEQEDITESERESAPEDHSSPSSKKPKSGKIHLFRVNARRISELAPSIHGLEALHKLKNISETMVFLSQIQLQTVSAFIDDYTDLKEEVELLRKENQRLKNNSNG